jgi:hypothetical protein
MNAPEKIAQAYLRLNGFFTVPHFTLLKDRGGHIDFLAVRLGGSKEKVGTESHGVPLEIDEQFLSKLGVSEDDTVGLVVEVKGGERDNARITDENFEYAKSFFGNISRVKKVGFENNSNSEIIEQAGHIIVPLKHCIDFIKKRFDELKQIEQQLRGSGMLSKEGSWELSEEFLSDLLFLQKLGGCNL